MNEADQHDWGRYCRGERAALERIFTRHRDAMYTYCLYMTGSREDSEDLVQDAFVRLARQNRKEPIRSLRNWLFVCVRNLTLNLLTKKPPRPVAPVLPNPVASPEVHAFVQQILDRLSPDDRELVLLREQHGFTPSELASMLDLTPEAVRVRLFRARKKMQKLAKE